MKDLTFCRACFKDSKDADGPGPFCVIRQGTSGIQRSRTLSTASITSFTPNGFFRVCETP